MSETKFTKGPWKLRHGAIIANKTDEDGDPIVIGVAMGTTKRYPPKGLDCYSIPPQAEAQANRALIAAAPLMYSALKWLEVYAQVQVRNHPQATDTPNWQTVLDALAAADGTKEAS